MNDMRPSRLAFAAVCTTAFATSIIIIGRATLRKLLRRHYLHNKFERDPEWAQWARGIGNDVPGKRSTACPGQEIFLYF